MHVYSTPSGRSIITYSATHAPMSILQKRVEKIAPQRYVHDFSTSLNSYINLKTFA